MTVSSEFGEESALVRWLRGDARDRERFAAMHERLEKVSFLAAPVAAVIILTAWWAGPALLVSTAIAMGTILSRPLWQGRIIPLEASTGCIFLTLEINAAFCIYFSGGARSPLIPLVAAPVCVQGACLRPRLFLFCCTTAAVVAAPAILLPPHRPTGLAGSTDATVSTPPRVVYWLACLALLLALATVGHVLAATDLGSRHEASVDALTGLYNRAALVQRFAGLRQQAQASASAISLLMLDIDHFKRINDENGHARGDQVLQEFAERLRTTLRGSDLLYRVGGEEFIVLLPGHPPAAALKVAERIRRAVSDSEIAGLQVTISQGVATESGTALDVARMAHHADQALYTAKRTGRDRVVAYTTAEG